MPFIYVIRILNGRRQEFIQYMADHGVDTGIHWQPGHGFSAFKNCRAGNLDVTRQLGEQIVTLPMYPGLSEDEIDRICAAVRAFSQNHKALRA